ncbi:MAG: hypothetical protein ACRC33_03235, partial [Gemmataceae bacterium]
MPARCLLLALFTGCLAAPAADDVHGYPLPPGAVARLGTTRFRHASFVGTGLAFAADGRTLVAGGDGPVLTVWDARTGQQLRVIRPGTFHAHTFALSPDG